MVESPEQIVEGLESGEYMEDDFVNVADTTYRICAPSNDKISSAIIWTKSGKDDKPDWTKVVSIFYYFIEVHYFKISS